MGTPTQLSDKTGRVVFEGTQAGGGGSQPVLVARAYLDHDAILALPTTLIELAPAPGPGKVLWLQTAMIYCDTTAGAYSNISEGAELGPCLVAPGDFLAFLTEAGTYSKVSTLLGAGSIQVATYGPQADAETVFGQPGVILPLVYDASTLAETSLKLVASNDGNYEDGDPANFMVVAVTYSIVNLTP